MFITYWSLLYLKTIVRCITRILVYYQEWFTPAFERLSKMWKPHGAFNIYYSELVYKAKSPQRKVPYKTSRFRTVAALYPPTTTLENMWVLYTFLIQEITVSSCFCSSESLCFISRIERSQYCISIKPEKSEIQIFHTRGKGHVPSCIDSLYYIDSRVAHSILTHFIPKWLLFIKISVLIYFSNEDCRPCGGMKLFV